MFRTGLLVEDSIFACRQFYELFRKFVTERLGKRRSAMPRPHRRASLFLWTVAILGLFIIVCL